MIGCSQRETPREVRRSRHRQQREGPDLDVDENGRHPPTLGNGGTTAPPAPIGQRFCPEPRTSGTRRLVGRHRTSVRSHRDSTRATPPEPSEKRCSWRCMPSRPAWLLSPAFAESKDLTNRLPASRSLGVTEEPAARLRAVATAPRPTPGISTGLSSGDSVAATSLSAFTHCIDASAPRGSYSPEAALAPGGGAAPDAVQARRSSDPTRQFHLEHRSLGLGVPLTDAQWARIEPLLPDRTPK